MQSLTTSSRRQVFTSSEVELNGPTRQDTQVEGEESAVGGVDSEKPRSLVMDA
jgi:hypothetical protein